jgi:hypothetical protein
MTRILFPLALGVALAGCSSEEKKPDRPKTVNASGVVSQKGHPLSVVLVMCQPESGGVACSAISDEKGKFSLMSFNPDPGAVPGKYKVAVLSTQQPQEHAEDVLLERNIKPKQQTPPLPVKYSKFETSGLTIEIPAEGTVELKVDLPE